MAESKFYLAIDIGASSGRHILGWLENGKIRLEELYRFENKLVKKNGHLCWDLEHLFQEVVAGLKKCRELERIPASIGIDTWGVDFVLLDKAGKVLGDTVAYRDSRTKGMDAELGRVIEEKDLYARNGIQKQLFNSIYQLLAIKQEHPEYLEQAENFLMIPEFLNYRLTGVAMNEYTNATTGQLVNAQTQDWDFELLEKAGIPTKIFGKLNMPKTVEGEFSEEISQDRFLNALIATETGKRVFAGPIEATAVGNLMAQMLKDGVFADLDEARKVVAKSFDVSEVEESWFSKFTAVCSFSLAQRNEPKK